MWNVYILLCKRQRDSHLLNVLLLLPLNKSIMVTICMSIFPLDNIQPPSSTRKNILRTEKPTKLETTTSTSDVMFRDGDDKTNSKVRRFFCILIFQ